MKRLVAASMLGAFAIVAAVVFRHRSAGPAPADPVEQNEEGSAADIGRAEPPATPAVATDHDSVAPAPPAPAAEARARAEAEAMQPHVDSAGHPVRSTAIMIGGNYPNAGVGRGPASSPQSVSAFINDYRAAVCACSSRTCVRDLQSRFVRMLSSVQYDEQRDGQAYSEAARDAVNCYTRLPSDS